MANYRLGRHSDDYFLPLDNSAVFIASVTSRRLPFVFRISCELDEPLCLPDLECALAITLDRFPFFRMRLRPGIFWYYLDPWHGNLRVMSDARYPCELGKTNSWGRSLFRVRAYNSRIVCEFHHVLTDGTGALEFLRTLTAVYLTRRGVQCPDWGSIIRPESPVDPAEHEDAYESLYNSRIPFPEQFPPAFHLPGKRFSGPEYRITTLTLSVSEMLNLSRSKGVSITEYLTAVHAAALQDVAVASGAKPRPIAVQVPVNLRKFYPSKTLRNFFLFATVLVDCRLGFYEFDEILSRAHHTLRMNLTARELTRHIKRNVRGERYLHSRLVPLALKNLFLRIYGVDAADRPYSGSISNLQGVQMPSAFAQRIKRFDFIPPRAEAPGAGLGVVSWGDLLSISIGSVTRDRSFERFFCRRLTAAGLTVYADSNC